MAYYPLSILPTQLDDDDGTLLSGGTIEAFVAGTSTPTNMFTDKDGTSAGDTVTLNARGEPEVSANAVTIFLDTDVSYKFVLKDADGNTIYTIDDIPARTAAGLSYNQGGANADDRTIENRLRDRAYTKDWGAVADGVTNDGAKFLDAYTDEDAINLSKGTSIIGASVTIGSGEAIYGQPITALIVAKDDFGNGLPVFAVTGTAVRVEGIDVDLPATLANQARAIRVRDANDVFLTGNRLTSLKRGAWPVLIDQDINRVAVVLSEIDTIAYGIIWKPNVAAPTSETYQGTQFLAALNMIRGASSEGRIGISIDGNCEGGAVIGNHASDMQGEDTSQGFGFALANDGGDLDKLSGIAIVANVGRNTKDQVFHQEDKCNGIIYLGNIAIDGSDGLYVINDETPRNIIQALNFARDLSETAFYVAGTGSSSNLNLIGNIGENWGTGGADEGLLVGQGASSYINVLANILDQGTGDAFVVQANSRANIAYNIARGASGDALVLGSAPASTVYIESNNILSDVTGDPVDQTTVNGASGDRDLYKTVTVGSAQTHILHHFRRPGVIVRVEAIYNANADGATPQTFDIGFDGGADVITNAALKDASPGASAYDVENFSTFVTRLVPAGSVLTLNLDAGSDSTFDVTFRVNFFEYS